MNYQCWICSIQCGIQNMNLVTSLSSDSHYKLYQAVAIFNDNCEYGKVYLEEY